MRALRMPRRFVIAQHLKFRFFPRNIDQYQVVHIIADENRVVRVGMIVIAIKWHIDSFDDVAPAVCQSDEWNHRVLIDLDIRRDGLRAIRRDRAVMPRSTIVEKEITVARPEFVPNRVLFSLAKTRMRFTRNKIQ